MRERGRRISKTGQIVSIYMNLSALCIVKKNIKYNAKVQFTYVVVNKNNVCVLT
jgi:hypothetical protein